MIRIKRAYEKHEPKDGKRVLVDRLWPRGLTKAKARIDVWMREISPSNELRQWYQHDPEKWDEFKERYRKELKDQKVALRKLADWAKEGELTFIYSAKDDVRNNAVALKEIVERLGKDRDA